MNVKNALLSFFGANLGLSIVAASLLQYLWSMINALQILVLSALFDLNIPDSAFMVMELILKMCSMDFFQTDSIFEELFNFRETEEFGKRENLDGEEYSKYPQAGYDSSNFFLLLGPLFFVIIAYLLFIAVKNLA